MSEPPASPLKLPPVARDFLRLGLIVVVAAAVAAVLVVAVVSLLFPPWLLLLLLLLLTAVGMPLSLEGPSLCVLQ